MKLASLSALALCAALSPFAVAQTDTVRWTFDGPKSELTKLNPPWETDLHQTTTTGSGELRIRRGLDTPSNAFARLPDEFFKKPLWLLVRVAQWNLTGTSNETVRLGFSSNDDIKTPSVVAQVKFERKEKNMLLSGEAMPASLPNASLEAQPVGKGIAGGKVDVLLYIDPKEQKYKITYKTAQTKEWKLLGEGSISKTRQARYLRLGVSGPFDTNRNEEFEIDEIVVSLADPSK